MENYAWTCDQNLTFQMQYTRQTSNRPTVSQAKDSFYHIHKANVKEGIILSTLDCYHSRTIHYSQGMGMGASRRYTKPGSLLYTPSTS